MNYSAIANDIDGNPVLSRKHSPMAPHRNEDISENHEAGVTMVLRAKKRANTRLLKNPEITDVSEYYIIIIIKGPHETFP